jgi:hypothetical protein
LSLQLAKTLSAKRALDESSVTHWRTEELWDSSWSQNQLLYTTGTLMLIHAIAVSAIGTLYWYLRLVVTLRARWSLECHLEPPILSQESTKL